MAYTKYLVSGAVAVALLTGCGSDSDKKETTVKKVQVNQENASTVAIMSQYLTFIGVELFTDEGPDEMGGPSAPKLLYKPSPKLIPPSEEYPQVIEDCSNQDGNHSIDRVVTETSTVYTETYTNCETHDMFLSGIADGTYKWTYTDSETAYNVKYEVDVEFEDEEEGSSGKIDFTSMITETEDLDSYAVDGYFSTSFMDDETNQTVKAKIAYDELTLDVNTSEETTFSVNGSVTLDTPELSDVNATCNLLGKYTIETIQPMDMIFFGGAASEGIVKINGATFDYTVGEGDVNVTIPNDGSYVVDQAPNEDCLDEGFFFFGF